MEPDNYPVRRSSQKARYSSGQQYVPHQGSTQLQESPYIGPPLNGASISRDRAKRGMVDQPIYHNNTAPMPAPPGTEPAYYDPSQYTQAPPSSRSRGNPKSFASRANAQPELTIPASRAPDHSLHEQSPISPTSRSVAGAERRASVPHRSPLQKLEVALDDISKEEKRAKVELAEYEAQQRGLGRSGTIRRSSRDVAYEIEQQRQASNPEAAYWYSQHTPKGQSTSRRVVSEGNEGLDYGLPTWKGEEQAMPQRVGSLRQAAMPTREPSSAKRGPPLSSGFEHRRAEGSPKTAPDASPTSTRPRPVSGGFDRPVPGHPQTGGLNRGPSYKEGGEHGLGLYEPTDRTPDEPSPSASGKLGRSNSRKLQKAAPANYDQKGGFRDPGRMGAVNQQLQTDRMGASHGNHKAARTAAELQDDDPVPLEAVRNRHGDAPAYEIPPQTAGGQKARAMLGFGNQEPVHMAPSPAGHDHPHLDRLLHRNAEPERKYQRGVTLEEWKGAVPAALTAEDFMLDGAAPAEEGPNKAWWEKSGGSQRRRSGGRPEAAYGAYDGAKEESRGPTSFQPPLYIKCGPLLRYTGMRFEPPRAGAGQRAREIWRGSLMMVTIDSQSVYNPAPTLRLFAQPMDLLPPPPAQLDAENGQHLAPEYVDPIAGQIKMSRTGKTLYVKPVEHLEEEKDVSRIENDDGLFEQTPSPPSGNGSFRTHDSTHHAPSAPKSRIRKKDGERMGKYKQIKAIRLHAERGVTFWRFNLEVELGPHQARVAYRINKGPAIGFWVPGRGQSMNIMFHSCNGFSLSVNPNQFSGPDPLWRDVLNTHQFTPFHVMIGGGDQIYNDAAMRDTTLFREWLATKSPVDKHSAEFTVDMQEELENFYLNRYCMWFSQGLFGMANSQIPMINLWDDHDIIDGFGSYPHHFMSSNVFTGLGAIAFKYYMLFQQQSVPDETTQTEPSWLLGAAPGPYINELSRSIFLFLGRHIAFLGLDCRTERMRDEILSQETYDLAFDRCYNEIVKGETKHLIVLLGVPIAYPRLNFLEYVLTSRLMDPIKAIGRTGALGGFVNKFDGGVEILDDLDDHWTAKHHKRERNWFIQELQELAAEKSVRVTILGGDVHLGAVGQFYSNKALRIPKDRDHRYMPNVISSAIVNTPPPPVMADILNRRNKIHHLDGDTDEDMIPMFPNDADGKPRNNNRLLPRRNWCSIREYHPGSTPPPTPPPVQASQESFRRNSLTRSLSLTRKDFTPGGLVRRLSGRGNTLRGERDTGGGGGGGPPVSYANHPYSPQNRSQPFQRSNSVSSVHRPSASADNYFPPAPQEPPRPNPFHRRPTGFSEKAANKEDERTGHIDLEGGLDIVLNVEVNQKDPAGITTPYRLLVPALWYEGTGDTNTARFQSRKKGFLQRLGFGGGRRGASRRSIDVSPEDTELESSVGGTPGPGGVARSGTSHGHGGPPHHQQPQPHQQQQSDYQQFQQAMPGRGQGRERREHDNRHSQQYQIPSGHDEPATVRGDPHGHGHGRGGHGEMAEPGVYEDEYDQYQEEARYHEKKKPVWKIWK